MIKIKRLFWEIFTEHAGVQVLMYSVMFLFSLILFLHNGYSSSDSFVYGLIIPVGMKSISLVSSLFKACFIIKKCNEGNTAFKKIYKEWTGEIY